MKTEFGLVRIDCDWGVILLLPCRQRTALRDVNCVIGYPAPLFAFSNRDHQNNGIQAQTKFMDYEMALHELIIE